MASFFDQLYCMLFGWLYSSEQPCSISGYEAATRVNTAFQTGQFVKGGKSRKNRNIKRSKKTRTNKHKSYKN
jgi:hypothetical protein